MGQNEYNGQQGGYGTPTSMPYGGNETTMSIENDDDATTVLSADMLNRHEAPVQPAMFAEPQGFGSGSQMSQGYPGGNQMPNGGMYQGGNQMSQGYPGGNQMPNGGMYPGGNQIPPQGAYSKPPKDKKDKNNKKNSHLGLIIALICAGVLLIAGGIFAFIYTRPNNKRDRILKKAKDLIASEDYEGALEEYDKALDIEPGCIEAIVGGIDCYKELDKADDFETFYVNSLTSVEEMSDEEIQDNKEDIVYIYQSASDVYADDLDQRIEVLEKGYELTGQDSTIQSELAGSFVEVAKNCAADDDVDGELGAYGDALDVDPSNAAAISGMSDCLNNEISTDIDNGDLEAAEALINEYENSDYSLNDVDFAGYRTKIEDQRAIIDQRNTVMQSAYNYMSAKDYESMNELDGSTEADEVAYNITDYFIYSENGAESKDYTGTAVAIFKFSDGYCFYYGDLVDGKREGTGSYFMSSGSKYEVYEGAWSENLPNGSGTYTEKDASAGNTTIDKVTKGTFTDGLQNGSMSGTVTYNGNTYTGSWTATNGKAPDVSANYPDYDFSSVDSSYIIYAVFSPTGSDNYFFYSYKKEDDILGIFGIDY